MSMSYQAFSLDSRCQFLLRYRKQVEPYNRLPEGYARAKSPCPIPHFFYQKKTSSESVSGPMNPEIPKNKTVSELSETFSGELPIRPLPMLRFAPDSKSELSGLERDESTCLAMPSGQSDILDSVLNILTATCST